MTTTQGLSSFVSQVPGNQKPGFRWIGRTCPSKGPRDGSVPCLFLLHQLRPFLPLNSLYAVFFPEATILTSACLRPYEVRRSGTPDTSLPSELGMGASDTQCLYYLSQTDFGGKGTSRLSTLMAPQGSAMTRNTGRPTLWP